MTPVVLHLGFHKTGTSSAQSYLDTHRTALAPYLTIALLDSLNAAEKAARRFSKRHDSFSLIETAAAFDHSLTRVWPDPSRALLISCEGLAGDIPGRAGVTDYGALTDLAPVYLECLASRRPDLDSVSILLTLRDPATWLHSAWLENLWGTKLTLDYDAYAETNRASADLPAIAEAVRAACPGTPVVTAWLEDTGPTRLGPATALLSPFALPDPLLQGLPPAHRTNPAMAPHLIPACLALNRGPLQGQDLKAAKRALLAPPPKAP